MISDFLRIIWGLVVISRFLKTVRLIGRNFLKNRPFLPNICPEPKNNVNVKIGLQYDIYVRISIKNGYVRPKKL